MKLNDLKKNVFFELLNIAGRVYMVVRYSPNVDLGRKVFTEDEKTNGLTLVFTTRMNIQWDSVGLATMLTFGSQAYRCFIPAEDILAIYSPDLQVQLTCPGGDFPATESKSEHPGQSAPRKKAGQVIEIDFATRLRKNRSATEEGDRNEQ